MKKIMGLVVVLAVLVLGSYYLMGVVTEKTVKHDLATVNKSNGLFVKVVSYNRGWFTSTADLHWKLHIPERIVKKEGVSQSVPAQDLEMQMPLVIYHGPIIVANNTMKLGLGFANTLVPLPEKYREQFNANYTPESIYPKLDLSLFVTYLNNSQIEMVVPAFKLIEKEGGEFVWNGMTSTTKLSGGARKIKGGFTIDGMSYHKNDIQATSSEISSGYRLHQTKHGLYLGDANLSFPSLVIRKNGTSLFELSKLNFHTNSDIDDGLFYSDFKFSLKKILVDGKNYGPAQVDLSIKNLDAEVLGRINEQVKKAQQGTEREKQQAWFSILPEIPKLLSKGPEIEISKFNFVMPEGALEGNAFVSLPKNDSANPLNLMQKLRGQARLKVPAEVVKKVLLQSNTRKLKNSLPVEAAVSPATPVSPTVNDVSQQATAMTEKQIDVMLKTGLITQEGSYYRIEVSLDQGRLLVNSKPFDPAMVKF